ncbi:hypothetical protein LPJ81_006094, partial [Coemansia sp. IMI 209127]
MNNVNLNSAMPAPSGGPAQGLDMLSFGGYMGQPASADGVSRAPAFPPEIAISSSMVAGIAPAGMFPPGHGMPMLQSSAPQQFASQPAQSAPGGTPLIPHQLLLNASSAGNAWGMQAHGAQNSNMFAQQQYQGQQDANSLLAQIASLHSQPLQSNTLTGTSELQE